MKFVEKIAQFILEKNVEAKHLTVILPSERAIKYISAALFRLHGKPVIAPEFISIDRWVRKHTKQNIVDKTRLLILLFKIQEEHPLNSEQLSFEEFMSWGQTLLADFDEMDRYQLDSKTVFRNLSSIKELEHWNVEAEKLSETQKRFMEFWDKLPEYYQLLNEKLASKNSCYIGKAYRQLADDYTVLFEKDKEHHFIFAGFNALSKSELSLMKQLHKYGKADILFDSDEFYLKNTMHEAGMFHREILKELEVKDAQFIGNTLSSDEKLLTVIECAQQTGQVKVAANILSELPLSEMDDTLVLLADESLVVPFIKNIPAKVGTANISLGLPFRNSPIKTWIELVFNIQENQIRYKTKAIYHQDLRVFWNHSFTNLITSEEERKLIVALEQEAVSKNRVFRNAKNISVSKKLDKLLQTVIEPWEGNWQLAMQKIKEALHFLLSEIPPDDEFNQSLIESFLATIQEFNNIVLEGLPEMTIRSFKLLFQQHWFNKSIAYHGNPTKGLQVMGLLETRLLDFKNLIVIGFNEGNLPPLNPINTFIPMDLRLFLGLPTPREKQGLFAHHFYRLLHYSKNIWATYSTAMEKVGSNEESRYLMQLELELQKENKDFKVERKVYAVEQTETNFNESLQIQKTSELLAKLDEKLASSTSMSLLNKYLACPMDFFYRYIAEFGETDEIEEQMESNTMGSIVHKTLEDLYEPFARHDNKGEEKSIKPPAITTKDIDLFLKHYDTEVRKNFAAKFDNDKQAFSSGKNLLILQVALEMTKKFLLAERKWLEKQTEQVFIEYLELTIVQPLEISVQGEKKVIQFKGIIDRIDSIGGKFRIIDYKTGSVEQKHLNLKLETDADLMLKVLKNKENKHGLQLSMYTYLFLKQFDRLPHQVGIISFIKLKNGLFNLETESTSLGQFANHFPLMVESIVEEMYNRDLLIEHKEDARYCLYCENKKPEKNF